MLKRKLIILRLMLCPNGYSRGRYLRKIRFFRCQGEHCFFIPSNYGTEPWMISFGDNVHVASGVRFVTHDVSAKMFAHMEPHVTHTSRIGPIEVGSNVFIGSGATILYDVRIGDNVIVAAGALVNRSLESGGIYGGIPARRIGNFADYVEKSRDYSARVPWNDGEELKIRREKQMAFFYPSEER